jgi:hypothetical protein
MCYRSARWIGNVARCARSASATTVVSSFVRVLVFVFGGARYGIRPVVTTSCCRPWTLAIEIQSAALQAEDLAAPPTAACREVHDAAVSLG